MARFGTSFWGPKLMFFEPCFLDRKFIDFRESMFRLDGKPTFEGRGPFWKVLWRSKTGPNGSQKGSEIDVEKISRNSKKNEKVRKIEHRVGPVKTNTKLRFSCFSVAKLLKNRPPKRGHFSGPGGHFGGPNGGQNRCIFEGCEIAFRPTVAKVCGTSGVQGAAKIGPKKY